MYKELLFSRKSNKSFKIQVQKLAIAPIAAQQGYQQQDEHGRSYNPYYRVGIPATAAVFVYVDFDVGTTALLGKGDKGDQ